MRPTGSPPPRLTWRQISALALVVCLAATAISSYLLHTEVPVRLLLVPLLLGGVTTAALLAFVSTAQVRARRLAEAALTESVVVHERDRMALDEAQQLNQLGRQIGAELDLEKLAQSIVDGGIQLVGASCGALIYESGGHRRCATSGFSREFLAETGADGAAFASVPGMRSDERVLRVADVASDQRFRRKPPIGHPKVRSYLAAAVVSRSGQPLGGLAFGHPAPGRFQESHERLVTGLSEQAAIAIENAQLYQQSREALSTRDEFFSIASHELRTPLTSLRLQIEGTLHQTTRGEALQADKVAARLEGALRQVSRISTLIDRMLDISRIGQGRLVMEVERLDLVELLREVTQRFAHEAERCGSIMELRCPEPVVGVWDRLRLEQVASNLISNALKYGGGRPVELDVGREGETARLLIRDHGIGIAAPDQARLFGQFERLVSSRNFSGFGLGLWVSRRIVEEIGGSISVSSELGLGSTFVVTLPLNRAAEAPIAANATG